MSPARKYIAFVVAAVALAGNAAAVLAQDKDLPKAEALIEKFIEAIGGRAAHEKLNNSVAKVKIEIVGQNINGTVTAYTAKPDKFYSLAEISGFGKIEEGTDGKVYWSNSMVQGPAIKEGKERAFAERSSRFNGVLYWRELYKSVETVGAETLDGRECYKVQLTPPDGKPEVWYFDKESGLHVRTDMRIETPMGEIPAEAFMSDYTEVQGVKTPHTMRVIAMGGERRITTESVEYNVDMPKDRFDLPDDIKKLLEKKATSAPAGTKPDASKPAEPKPAEPKPGEKKP
ncbi:MAG: hypothetical protein CHACPFDD_01103 [Phycisphaerae bacterium]|nr:hypothetical protein [Phycisphaerae bacterium]